MYRNIWRDRARCNHADTLRCYLRTHNDTSTRGRWVPRVLVIREASLSNRMLHMTMRSNDLSISHRNGDECVASPMYH